ncbi:YoaK family protein [Paenibacillus sp. Z6-24]
MQSVFYRNLIILLLCLVSGIVDVIGYLQLGHVFTANMTGNIIIMGMALGHLHTVSLLRSGAAFAGFIVGNAAAALFLGRSHPGSVWSSRMTMIISVQLVFFLVFAWLSSAPLVPAMEYMLIILLSFTMGMQTTMARKLGVAGISTTVLTNNLASVIEDLVAHVRQWFGRSSAEQGRRLSTDTVLRFAAVIIYGAGAVVAALIEQSHTLLGIWIPIVVMVIILVIAYARFRHSATSH